MLIRPVLSGILLATALTSPASSAPRAVLWNDLRADAPAEAHEGEIALKGYLLPIDREGDLVYEFVLVPWIGACSHTPAPPLDQIVHVRPATPYKLKENYEPVSVSGVIEDRETLSQLFLVDGVTEIETGYAIRRAGVQPTDRVPDAIIAPGGDATATPWKFLKK